MKTEELTQLEGWSVGQVVAEEGRGASLTSPKLVKITRITSGRGGTIYIGNQAYDKSGFSRGTDTWGGMKISVATPEVVRAIHAKRAKAFLHSVHWDSLTDDQALTMYTEYRKLIPKV